MCVAAAIASGRRHCYRAEGAFRLCRECLGGPPAGVAELVDAPDLGSGGENRGGSILRPHQAGPVRRNNSMRSWLMRE